MARTDSNQRGTSTRLRASRATTSIRNHRIFGKDHRNRTNPRAYKFARTSGFSTESVGSGRRSDDGSQLQRSPMTDFGDSLSPDKSRWQGSLRAKRGPPLPHRARTTPGRYTPTASPRSHQLLPSQPPRIVRRQEHRHIRHVAGLSHAPERRLRHRVRSKSEPMIPWVCVPSVSTIPGLMLFTRILRGPNSLASTPVMASTAPLVAQ